MKTDLLSHIRSLFSKREADVFRRTQTRLTVVYSGLLMLFLTLFIVIVYALLYVVILEGQRRELESLTGQESKIIEEYLVENELRELQGIESQEMVLAGADQFFYYVVDRSGNLVMGNETVPSLRTDLLGLLHGWIPKRNEIRQETLQAAFPKWGINERRENRGGPHARMEVQEIRLMIDGRPIFYRDQFIGMLYIGKDISFAYHLFHWLLLIFIGLAVLFIGIALYISYIMSKKAMIPITRAFARQREFVADASHELRTPLSVMLSSINAMEMMESIEEDSFSRKLLANMKDEVKRMTGLVSDLLTLARSDSGTIEHVHETFDFLPRAEKAIQSVGSLAAAKHIELSLQAPETITVKGDSERLTQLLYILLDNGIKYTPDGGKVSLVLSVESSGPRPMLCITVQDTGIGIKQEDHDRIFDRFYRSDKSRTRKLGGHGLGLAIAKWIVDIHQGTIGVSSEVGHGTTFTIQIPISGK